MQGKVNDRYINPTTNFAFYNDFKNIHDKKNMTFKEVS